MQSHFLIFFKAVYKYWMVFAKILGKINTSILLTAVYFVVCPFIAIPGVIFFRKSQNPYWNKISNSVAQERNYKYQF